MPITLRDLWENLVKAWSKLVLDTLMLNPYYRSTALFKTPHSDIACVICCHDSGKRP